MMIEKCVIYKPFHQLIHSIIKDFRAIIRYQLCEDILYNVTINIK